MKTRLVLLSSVLIAFSLYTAAIVVGQGYLGFLELAWTDAWGGQMFVDLCIALVLFVEWMRRDAQEHGISPWPYLALIVTTGAIGALGYLVHRTARELRAPAPEGSVAR